MIHRETTITLWQSLVWDPQMICKNNHTTHIQYLSVNGILVRLEIYIQHTHTHTYSRYLRTLLQFFHTIR